MTKHLTLITLGLLGIAIIQATIITLVYLAALFLGLRIFGNHDYITQLTVMFLGGLFAGGVLATSSQSKRRGDPGQGEGTDVLH